MTYEPADGELEWGSYGSIVKLLAKRYLKIFINLYKLDDRK